MARKKADTTTPTDPAPTPARPAAKAAPKTKAAPAAKKAAATDGTAAKAVSKPSAKAASRKPDVAAPVPPQAAASHAPVSDVLDLLEQLRRGDLASRCAAAKALAPSGSPHATAALVEALRDPTAEVAVEAAAALGSVKDPTALAALLGVVWNGDGYFHGSVRAAAATSLGALGDASAVDALASAVYDPIAETSLAAVRALGVLGDARARPALETAAANASGWFLPEVQAAAADALGFLPG